MSNVKFVARTLVYAAEGAVLMGIATILMFGSEKR